MDQTTSQPGLLGDLQRQLAQIKMPDLAMSKTPPSLMMRRDPAADLLMLAENSRASNICRQLVVQLNSFNRELDPDLEVGVCIIGVGGQDITFRPTNLQAWDPALIVIFGLSVVDNRPVHVVQHVSQLSIAFVSLQRVDPAQPKRQIGFHSQGLSEEQTAEETQR